ncbi:MAG TPA: threonine--tRNA ligase [Candidatus Binatia bacterium]|jgi:threonyl-tRNA synthetase|nr:threonine--tRNA ligase [Candidatus Binatia bacterium]
MEPIHVTLPDGKSVDVRPGTRIDEVVASAGLKKDIIAAKVDGRPVDLQHALESDCALELMSPNSAEGLDILRHSTAHLMAQAVQQLFPGTQVTIGPTIEDGFYYDFKRDKAFSPEELEQIEKRMQELARANLTITREEMPRAQAIDLFRKMGENYKVEIIEGIPDEKVSLYRQGDWVDLCRGPHVPSTSALKAFKLTSLAGAYWRGDSRNEQLQRIYGTAWANRKDLDAYLKRIEEAKQRDHRRLGPALDLFSLHPIAPGSPFFHPKGTIVYNILIQFIRSLYDRYGYTEVVTPLIYKTDLWKTSGHYEAFKDDMFLMDVHDGEYGVKPMNCPGHCYLFTTRKYSYRDLPIRYADFSRLHRFEPSGVLSGLTRVRSFAQDDAHIYCTPEQLDSELEQFVAMTKEVYKVFGFDRIEVTLQTRPEKFLGRIELWDSAETALRRCLERSGFSVKILPGEGAFYGPKIGFDFRDVLERSWTLATVQIDCAMPERFGLKYVTSEGTEATPVMLHRAVLGSIERFIAILLEHCAGAFPLWLAPVQLKILTVTDNQMEYAKTVFAQLRAAGCRVELDGRNEKLGYKIREAQLAKIPYAIVIGDKEAEAQIVAPRRRGGENLTPLPLGEFIERLRGEVAQEMGEA